MKKLYTYICFFLCFFLSFPIHCSANDKKEIIEELNEIENITNETIKETVFDNANILTEEEENKLREVNKFYETYQISVVFLTVSDTQSESTDIYADNFYDNGDFLPDGILYMINMNNHEIYINTKGNCIDILSNNTINNILDESFYYATNGQYYNCLNNMEQLTRKYIVSYYEKDNQAFYLPTKENLIMSVIITVGIMVLLITNHNKANRKPKAQIYLNGNIKIINKNDIFLGDKREVLHNYYKQNNAPNGDKNFISSDGIRYKGGWKF